jgi:hypothetical protein
MAYAGSACGQQSSREPSAIHRWDSLSIGDRKTAEWHPHATRPLSAAYEQVVADVM